MTNERKLEIAQFAMNDLQHSIKNKIMESFYFCTDCLFIARNRNAERQGEGDFFIKDLRAFGEKHIEGFTGAYCFHYQEAIENYTDVRTFHPFKDARLKHLRKYIEYVEQGKW